MFKGAFKKRKTSMDTGIGKKILNKPKSTDYKFDFVEKINPNLDQVKANLKTGNVKFDKMVNNRFKGHTRNYLFKPV